MAIFLQENLRNAELGVTMFEAPVPKRWNSFSEARGEQDTIRFSNELIGEINPDMEKIKLEL